jgi:hypothetical protein
MKPLAVGLALLALMMTGAPGSARQPCDVRVDITDTDPHGTNVRATPGGAVIAALKNPGDGWIAVHVTAQDGDWFEIDGARLVDSDPEGKSIFRGNGYLHRSVLGVSGMQNGGTIYVDHDSRSRPLDPHAAGDQKVDLLGCWDVFLKVHVDKGTGWTTQACTNMKTTCN